MKRTPLILLCFFSLLLAACGGGGGGNVVPSNSGGGTGGTATATPSPTPSPTPTPTPVPGTGSALSGPRAYQSAWGPPAVAQDLDLPVQHGYDGKGQSVAIVIDSGINTSDLNAFLQYFQIPATSRTINTVSVDAASGVVSSEQGEATLDAETVAALAPGANVLIYQVPDLSDQSVIDAYNKILSDGQAHVVNSSWGGCETPGDPGVSGAHGIDSIMAAGSASGVAFVASSGDNGNECFTGTTPQYQVGVSWPASNPNAIAAGGTQTDGYAGESLIDPVVWNDKNGAGSGGVSAQYAIPSYQTASLLANCRAAAGGSPCSTVNRNVPDISMPAAGVAVRLNGGWHVFDGTSWSAPEYAALMAQLYQYCNVAAGVANPVTIPYFVYAQNRTAFIDVTSGNDQYQSTTPFYTAGAGFDDAGGLGVPHGMTFAQTACPNRTPAGGLLVHATSMSAASAAVQHPAQDPTLDVTPQVRGLLDAGARSDALETRIQFVVQPANAAASEAAIISALQNAGFTVTQRFSNHLVIDAIAPAGTVNRFFRTSLHDVVQARYGTRYMPATRIIVPAAIAPYVAGVSLDNVVKFHTAPH